MKTKQTVTRRASPIPRRSFRRRIATGLLAVTVMCSAIAQAQEGQIPLIRGPGVSQEQLEAVAEANGQTTLTDQLDLLRPGSDMTDRLHRLVERAQNTWLSGSIENARGAFREIARLAIEADWRPAQREAIHYAYLRLAQSATTPIERDEWLQKAVAHFPDLMIEEDVFPPPLAEQFRTTRTRVLGLSIPYSPYEHFPDYRYILINGRRFVIAPDLKIRLPNGVHRITALSDVHLPMTEKFSTSQLESFRISRPMIASGSCERPQALEAIGPLTQFTVVYSPDCMPTKTAAAWLPRKIETSDSKMREEPVKTNESLTALSAETPKPLGSSFAEHLTEPTASGGKTWIWIGLSAVVIGAVYAVQASQKETSHDSPPKINPVHRTGM